MRDVVRGVLLAVGYATATYYLRIGSSAHWYLPSGLRFASLMLIPMRYWPCLYAGECVALFAVRWPDVDRWGLPFLVVSTLSYMPPVAAIILLARKYTSLPRICTGRDAVTFICVAMFVAAVSTLVNTTTTYALMLDRPAVPAPYVVGIWLLGHYLGILIFATSALLWFNRPISATHGPRLLREAIATAALLATALLVVRASPDNNTDAVSHAARMVFGIAAVALTYRHGWRGASVGAIALILAVGLTGRSDYDPSLLVTQQVVALVASSLLASGAVMTHSRDVAAHEALARRQAEDAWRMAWRDTEEQNSENLERAEALYGRIMRESDGIIASLRTARRAESIMRLTGDLMASTRAATVSVMREIYPAIVFSADGLFGALRAFTVPTGVQLRTSLSGNPKVLSREAALSAYRVATSAVDHFGPMAPSSISLRIRVWSLTGRTATYIRVEAQAQAARTSKDTASLARLRRRVTAYGGSMRNHRGQIVVLLPDGGSEATLPDRIGTTSRPVQTA